MTLIYLFICVVRYSLSYIPGWPQTFNITEANLELLTFHLLSRLTRVLTGLVYPRVLGVPPRALMFAKQALHQLNYISLPFFLSGKLTNGFIMVRLKEF